MRLRNLHNTQDPVFFVLFFSFKKGIFFVLCCFLLLQHCNSTYLLGQETKAIYIYILFYLLNLILMF